MLVFYYIYFQTCKHLIACATKGQGTLRNLQEMGCNWQQLIVLDTELLVVGTSFSVTSLLLCSSFLEHSSVSETSRLITAFPRNLQQFQLHPVSRPSPHSNLSWNNSKWFQSTTCCWWQATTEQPFIDQWRVVSEKAMAPLGFGRKPKGADGKEVPYTFKRLWYRVVKIPIGPGLFSIDSISVIELGIPQ